MSENRSEVARLMCQIEAEYTASKRALEAPAIVARHEFITKKMENIGAAHEELVQLVGEQEAIKLVAGVIWSPADQGVAPR